MSSLQHIPLHVHTEYSLLDGASKIDDLVSRAAELKLPGLAISDHGVMYGCYEFLNSCKSKGVKPIIGSEVYVINGDHTDKKTRLPLYHLVLLAKNERGYKNLTRIVSEACLNGFYYKPRISKDFIAQHSSDLICLTACLGGEVPNQILKGNDEEARKAAIFYRELFGDDFYLEIQDHGQAEEAKVNHGLRALSRELGVKVIATNDSHFTAKEDARAHDAILCIQTNRLVKEFPRMRFSGQEYLKSGDEMLSGFRDLEDERFVGDAIEACSLEIFEKIEGYPLLEEPKALLPEITLPVGSTSESHLKAVCYELLPTRYLDVTTEVTERLEYELKVMADSGFSSYFLIVWDFMNFAREQKIPVGPGRGSAAGSIVAYLLGITDIDPLAFNLLFERFLNPERKSMPDIDTDFCIERRGEVVDYVRAKYGEERVAQIITFNRLTSRAVIKDISRVLSYPYQKAENLAKTIPVVRGKPRKIDWMRQNHPEFKALYETDPEAQQVIDLATSVEGTNKSYGVHAAGIVISAEPLTETVPLTRSKEGGIITQYSMDHLANLGLLKMDFLGLRNLTTIEKTLTLIAQANDGKRVELPRARFDDKKVYELLSKGDLVGIFQLETSSGMKGVAREMKPSSIEDISAIIALYRPGPLDTGMIDDFIGRKHGRQKISYATPELEPILKDTYGTIVYQEQIMQIAQQLAGFSLGKADLLRRAMGKKKPEEMEKYREIFMSGCAERKINEKVAEGLFEQMLSFAEYCFNRSHSAAYAVISYQTAWLKANYPVEYLTALMSSVGGDLDKIKVYIAEAQRMKIEVLPPDLNKSGFSFTPLAGERKILFGLAAVKNVGEGLIQKIIEEREAAGQFKTIADLAERIDPKVLNRRALESLIESGALEDLAGALTRRACIQGLDNLTAKAQRASEDRSSGQVNLFGSVFGEEEALNIPNCPEFTSAELQRFEKELLGFYVSGHPLSSQWPVLQALASHNLLELAETEDGTEVFLPVLLTSLTKKMTKTNKLMAVGTVEDIFGKAEIVIFSRVLEECQAGLKEEGLYFLRGKLQQKSEGEFSIMVESISDFADIRYLQIEVEAGLHSSAGDWEGFFMSLRGLLRQSAGQFPVLIRLGEESLVLADELRVNLSASLLEKLGSGRGLRCLELSLK